MSERIHSLDDFLALFPEKPRRKIRNGFNILCPTHNDRGPSLSVTLKDTATAILVKCRAGCKTKDILKAKGLTMADLFLNSHKADTKPEHRTIEAVYHYEGFEVVRTSPKGFYQRRPDGKSGYINNLDGVTPTLYHSKEIETAISNGDVIWIAEGEKDVDNLWNIGLVATCNPMGAGKWRESYADSLTGAKQVNVLPDNDAPGIEHAQQVANSLAYKGIPCKLLQPFTDAKDVSDWLILGHTADKLQAIAESTPMFIQGPEILTTPSGDKVIVRCIGDVQPVAVNWLWYPYIPLGKLTMLSGDPGEGKSQLCTAIATAVSLGKGLPGVDSFTPGTVLIATAEDGIADTMRPRLDSSGADTTKVFVLDGLFTLDDSGIELLETAISRKHPLLVILDPLMAYLGDKLDVNKANQVRHVTARLSALAEKYQCAILTVRHLTKSKGTKAVYRGQGNVDLTAAARSELLAGHDPEDDNVKALVHIKSNLAKKGDSIGYRLESAGHDGRDCRFCWTGNSELTFAQISANEDGGTKLAEAMEFLTEILTNGKVLSESVSKLATERGISPATLNRAKKKLAIISKGEYESGKKGAQNWYFVMPGKGTENG